MTSRFLIYALCDPRTNEIRYVGLSSRGLERPKRHWTAKNLRERKDHCHAWVRSLLRSELLPEIEILEEFESSENLNEAEQFWIGYLRFIGCSLTNMTDGGGGTFGFKLSSDSLERMKQSKRGQPSSRKGKPAWNRGLTKETSLGVARQAKAMEEIGKGREPWNKGKTKKDLPGIAKQAEKISGKNNPFHSSKGRKIYGGRRWAK